MKTKYLLPHSLKLPGWIILALGMLLWIVISVFPDFTLQVSMPALYTDGSDAQTSGWFRLDTGSTSIFDEVAGLLVIVGALFVALSREKVEDEFIMKIRLESLVWAVIANGILIILSLYTVYGFSYLYVLDYSIVSIPLLFLCKFKFSLSNPVDKDINYLLPNKLKTPGWIILGIGVVLWLLMLFHIKIEAYMPAVYFNDGSYAEHNHWFLMVKDDSILNEITGLFVIVGLLFVGFSKEKIEDERINKIRYESLLWALIVNSILMILALFLIYGFPFVNIMIYNLVSVPILFIFKYKLALRKRILI